jgi:hypothetical protein
LTVEVDPDELGGPEADSDLPSDRRSWRDWYVRALVAGATLFCMGPSLVGARTLLSVNLITAFFPWRANGTDAKGHQVCSGDTVDSVMPGIAYVRSHLFSGHLASWQNIVAGGSPLGSLPDLGLLNPLSLPYFILPLSVAPAFVVLLTWVVAIGGSYLFLRRFAVSRPAATLAGFIFATSGFMVMWTNWPQTRVAAFIPALFWALERLIERVSPLDLVLLALILASMLLGGFPVVTGYTLYLAAFYLLVRVWFLYRGDVRRAVAVAAMAGGGVVLGVALSAVQMLPFLKWYQTASLSYRSGQASAGLPNSSLLTLISPNANGLCVGGKSAGVGGSPIELVGYIGAAAVILAVAGAAFGLRSRRPSFRGMRGFFVVAVVVIILLGWTSPTARSVTASLPAFAGNFVGRIRSVLGFGLAVLAALGFDWAITARVRGSRESAPALASSEDRRRWPTRPWMTGGWAWLVWIGCGLAGLQVVRLANRAAIAGNYRPSLVDTSRIPAWLVVATLVLVVIRRIGPDPTRTLALVLIPILVIAQGAQFFHAVLPGDNPDNFYPVTPTHAFLDAHIGHDRYAASDLTMYPATSLYYGLRTPTGHAFHDPAWQDLLLRVDPGVLKTYTFSDFGPSMNQNSIGNQPILDAMGVKYYVLDPSQLGGNVQPVPDATGSVSSAQDPIGCSIPGQPIRGVSVRVAQALTPSDPSQGVTVHLSVRTPQGVLSSGRFLGTGAAAGSLLSVAVAGEDIRSSGPLALSLWETGGKGPLVVSGSQGVGACSAVTPRQDGLKLVFADSGSIVYQRLDALPRIRWASRAVVIPSGRAQVSALGAGVPSNEVVLSRPGPPGSGLGAGVTVTNDSGDRIAAEVTASGSGYLVVADAMQQPGWKVTVDGKAAQLVPADHAMVAVFVPAGRHQIDMTYSAPGQVAGFAISCLAVVISVTIVVWDTWWRPGRRRRRPADGSAP